MGITLMAEVQEKKNIMLAVSSLIIRARYLIFIVFLVFGTYCAMNFGRGGSNADLTAFLPPETETKRGIAIMNDEFITYATADVMVSNVTWEEAARLCGILETLEHVSSVDFDRSRAHYADAAALFRVTFDDEAESEVTVKALTTLRKQLAVYDCYIHTTIGSNFAQQIDREMGGVLGIAAVVIAAILLFTSRSYFEVVVFFIVFFFAALFNTGTNFWLGEISSIANSIAIIMQLALAIDYSIIFSHRYQDEALTAHSTRAALEQALADSIIEISSSSLTTISGLGSLLLMQFRLGYDLGMVLSKGILFSLLSVFLLMPGLIMVFPGVIRRTAHRTLIPDIHGWGRTLMHSGYCFVWIFLLLVPAVIWCSGHTRWAFYDPEITELRFSESRSAMHKIDAAFEPTSTLALLVPHEDFKKEGAILAEAGELPGIKEVQGLANTEAEEGRFITDLYSPRMFAELAGIDMEEALLLFQAYGVRHEQYQAILRSTEQYQVPLVDLLLYLFELADKGVVAPGSDEMKMLDDLRTQIRMGVEQLRGDHWNRLIFTVALPTDSPAAIRLVEEIRRIAERQYGEGTVLLVGDITSARDLSASFKSDSLLISALTIGFVLAILLLTFRTAAGAVILVFMIQGSIWINFSFPFLQGKSPSFVTNMIVSAIQMGATIDYAIVLMNRYLVMRKSLDRKAAMIEAVNQSFPTVLTSGSILTIAGLLIAYRVTDVYVGHIGLAVGRGALTSAVLVLTVLPQLIVLCDGVIRKTTFRLELSGGEET